MILVSIVLEKSRAKKDGSFPIVLRFTFKRKRKYIRTGLSAFESEWDYSKGLYKIPKSRIKKDKEKELFVLNERLRDLEKKANLYILKSDEPEFVVLERLVVYMSLKEESCSVLGYIDKHVKSLTNMEKFGSARNYKSGRSDLCKFLHGKDIYFEDFTYSKILKYIEWKKANGCTENTVMFYLRQLKVIFNKAIKEDLVDRAYYPFDKIRIKVVQTVKRALSKEEIMSIKNLDLEEGSMLDLARDMFIMSYYLRGISFKDLAFIKVKNIDGDRLYYNRAKTSVFYTIKLVDDAKRIIAKYNDLSNMQSFVFPIINSSSRDSEFRQYSLQSPKLNHRLKTIGAVLGLKIPLTTYVARHSWATIAKKSGVPISVISEGMGHSSEKMTNIYLKSFDNEVLDDMNELVTNLD